ncbi:hypothetical protein Tco_0439987 [Tanacetum coccineum]
MLHKALRFLVKLEQPIFLGGRESISHPCGLACKRSHGWETSRGSYSIEDVAILNTRHTPIQKQPEALLCLVGLSQRYYMGDDVYPTFLHDDGRDMDLFNLISAPNPTVIKTGTRPRAAHEVPLLMATANHMINIEDPATATESSGTPSTIEKLPLDFDNENPSQQTIEGDRAENSAQETVASETLPPGNSPTTRVAPNRETPRRKLPLMHPLSSKGDDLVDHQAPPGYFSKLRHLPNDDFLSQYNINFARQVAMGSQLRLRYKQEVKLLKKSVAQVARRDQRIQATESEIKNLQALLKAEADMKKIRGG